MVKGALLFHCATCQGHGTQTSSLKAVMPYYSLPKGNSSFFSHILLVSVSEVVSLLLLSSELPSKFTSFGTHSGQNGPQFAAEALRKLTGAQGTLHLSCRLWIFNVGIRLEIILNNILMHHQHTADGFPECEPFWQILSGRDDTSSGNANL